MLKASLEAKEGVVALWDACVSRMRDVLGRSEPADERAELAETVARWTNAC